MKEGLYAAHFITGLGSGAGVAVLSGGRIRGGDAVLYYLGEYQIEGTTFTATVTTARHTRLEEFGSVFGVDDAVIKLSGHWVGNMVTATGTSPQAPGTSFQAHLKWLSD